VLVDDHRCTGVVSVSTWTNVSRPAVGGLNGDQLLMSHSTPSSNRASTLNRVPAVPERRVSWSGETHIASMCWCT